MPLSFCQMLTRFLKLFHCGTMQLICIKTTLYCIFNHSLGMLHYHMKLNRKKSKMAKLLTVSICVLLSQIKCLKCPPARIHAETFVQRNYCVTDRALLKAMPQTWTYQLKFINAYLLLSSRLGVAFLPKFCSQSGSDMDCWGTTDVVKSGTPSVTCWKSNTSPAEVLQGSVVTHLRCGGKYNKVLAPNLLQSPMVKEFLKLVNSCQSYG